MVTSLGFLYIGAVLRRLLVRGTQLIYGFVIGSALLFVVSRLVNQSATPTPFGLAVTVGTPLIYLYLCVNVRRLSAEARAHAGTSHAA